MAADDDHAAGCFKVIVGPVNAVGEPERIHQGMQGYPVPVVIQSGLAASTQDQDCGIGFGLRKDAIPRTTLIADQAGIRAMLTRPIAAEAVRFYMPGSNSLRRAWVGGNCRCCSKMHAAGYVEA